MRYKVNSFPFLSNDDITQVNIKFTRQFIIDSIASVKSGEICCTSFFILPFIICCQCWMICSLIIQQHFDIFRCFVCFGMPGKNQYDNRLSSGWILHLHHGRNLNVNTVHPVCFNTPRILLKVVVFTFTFDFYWPCLDLGATVSV